ncbi:MAG: GntR family transcriptional regulator [Candidatus Aquilonibacter sp.]
MPLYLHADPGNGLPVYLQIADQVRRAVAIGILKAGEQLPTVKHIASTLVINPATVTRALRELEHLGIIETVPGGGAFVRGDAAIGVAATGARDVVRTAIESALREARSLGVEEDAVAQLFTDALATWYRGDGTHGA